MIYPFYDSTFLLLIPGLLLGIWAQIKVKRAFFKWSQINTSHNITGEQIAKKILRENSLTLIDVKKVSGELTDNYDPIKQRLNLSEVVYDRSSIAAVGVAAHEAGHAIQHNSGYYPLSFRNTFLPIANFGSLLAFPIFFIGLIMGYNPFLIKLGIILFSAFVIFTIVTLPIEFNASTRAIGILTNSGYFTTDEIKGVREILTAASLTYVASAVSALLNLARLLILSRGRD